MKWLILRVIRMMATIIKDCLNLSPLKGQCFAKVVLLKSWRIFQDMCWKVLRKTRKVTFKQWRMSFSRGRMCCFMECDLSPQHGFCIPITSHTTSVVLAICYLWLSQAYNHSGTLRTGSCCFVCIA